MPADTLPPTAADRLATRLAMALAAASALLLVYFVVPAPGTVPMVLVGAFPVALIAFGAAREGRLGPLAPTVWALLVVLEGAFGGMLLLRGRVVEGPWLFGLPLVAFLQLGGLFVLPLAIVSLGHARAFPRFTLRDDDLARLRERARSGRDRT